MGHPACEPSHGLELLRVAQLGLGLVARGEGFRHALLQLLVEHAAGFFSRFALGDVDDRSDVAQESAVGAEPRGRRVDGPAVAAIVPTQPVFQREGRTGGIGLDEAALGARSVFRVRCIEPSRAQAGFGRLPGELVPGPAQVGALPVDVGGPHHHRGVVGHRPETLLALAQGLCDLPTDPRNGQGAIHPGQQLARREGLDQVVVGAPRQAFDASLLSSPGRQGDHGQVAQAVFVAHTADQAEAIQARHHHVGQQQIRTALAHGFECFEPVGHDHAVVLGPQKALHIGTHVGVVVRDQDVGAWFAGGRGRAAAGLQIHRHRCRGQGGFMR